MLVDFPLLKQLLSQVIDPLDHQFLNDVPPFDAIEPVGGKHRPVRVRRIDERTRRGQRPGPGPDVASQVWETDDAVGSLPLVVVGVLLGEFGHFSGRSSRAKIAETGQTGTQAPQSMHSTGSM